MADSRLELRKEQIAFDWKHSAHASTVRKLQRTIIDERPHSESCECKLAEAMRKALQTDVEKEY